MIVRILGEGQLDVDDAMSAELNELDAKLEAAVNAGDEKAFRPALEACWPGSGRREHRSRRIRWKRRM